MRHSRNMIWMVAAAVVVVAVVVIILFDILWCDQKIAHSERVVMLCVHQFSTKRTQTNTYTTTTTHIQFLMTWISI